MSHEELEEWADKLANALGNFYMASMRAPTNKREQTQALDRDAAVYRLLSEYRDWRNA